MTKVAKKNETAALIKSRESALAEIVGPDRIKVFLANVLAELSPTNAKGQPNKLLQCSPQSFYAACHQAATLKLMPGPLKEVSLVPYGKTATLIVEYRGFITLALRHPDVLKVSRKCVYADDDFHHDLVTDEIRHKRPSHADLSDDNLVGAWCRVVLRDSPEPISEYMNRAQIEKRSKDTPFWRDWKAEMWQKTVVRSLLNSGMVPRTAELSSAIQHDIQQEKVAEIINTKTEHPAHVATEVEIGFSDSPYPQDDDPGAPTDNFGLDEPEVHDERSDLNNQITKQAIRLKLKPTQVLDEASKLMEKTVLDFDDVSLKDLQSILSWLEGLS